MEVTNNIPLDLTGCTTNLQLFPQGSSGSRVAMQGTHYVQAVQCVGSEQRMLFAGPERDYAKYMWNVVVEHTCRVIRIIHRRPKLGDVRTVLESLVFVERTERDAENRVVDVIKIPRFRSNHQTFGFELALTDIGERLHVGMRLEKGTVLAETPSIRRGEWCVGVHANAILVSHPQVIEDSCIISQSLADKMLTYGYKTLTLSIGQKDYPLFLYGTEDDPRLFPEVGEQVRPDGILFAKRHYDPLLAAVEMTSFALTVPDGHFDHALFVDPKSVVVDIKVHRNDTKLPRDPRMLYDKDGNRIPNPKMSTPAGMQEVCDEYADGLSQFQAEIRKFYRDLKREAGRNKQPPLSRQARQDIRYAIADNPREFIEKEERVMKQFGNDLIDDYVIIITVRYPIPLARSGKITDTMGGKGIVSMVVPDEDMPIDEHGNRVDILMSQNAMLRRTNFNRGFEHYVGGAAREVQKAITNMVIDGDYDAAWDYMMAFFNAINPRWAAHVERTHPTDHDRRKLLNAMDGDYRIRVHVPSDNPFPMDQVEENVKANFAPPRSRLRFPGPNGETVTTKEGFIVGVLYMIRLDKTGREFSAVSGGKFQSFGTIAKRHSADKNRRPISENPIKYAGESEMRHQAAFIGPDVCAEHHDRANNPAVAAELITNLLTADVVTNVDSLVDRKKFPLGHNRAMAINRHIMECDGVSFTVRRRGRRAGKSQVEEELNG